MKINVFLIGVLQVFVSSGVLGAATLENAQEALAHCITMLPKGEITKPPYITHKQLKTLMSQDVEAQASPWGQQWTALVKVVDEVSTAQGPLYISQMRHPQAGWYVGKDTVWGAETIRLRCLTAVLYTSGTYSMLTDVGSPQWNREILGPHLAPFLGFYALDSHTFVEPSPAYLAQRLLALNERLIQKGHPLFHLVFSP